MKKILALLTLALLLLPPTPAWPRTPATATVHISLQVEKFAEWADPSPIILATDWAAPIAHVQQTTTVSKTVILYTNTDTLITVKPGLHGGVLTNGAETLATAYRLTGAVANPDPVFQDSTTFFNPQNTYTVLHQSGTGNYPINLEVQATSPANTAPDEGLYTCAVILTAAW